MINLPKSVIDRAEKIFEEKKISQNRREEIMERLKEAYKLYVYEPGEAIGIVSAQSISEPATQMTMRSYHVAGSAGIRVTLGLPRLMEIFDARRTPTTPMMVICLDKQYNTKEKAREIAAKIKEIRVREIVTDDVIDLLNSQIEFKLDTKKLSLLDIKKEDIIENLKKNIKDITVKTSEDKLVIIPKKQDASIREMQKMKSKILDTHLYGIKGVQQVVVKKEGDEWVLNTLGSNLKKVMAVEGVDATRIETNDIHEVAKTLGIEAARSVIIREASKTLEEQGLEVDIRHIMLVADAMTATGKIQAIGRYGVAGSKGSVLARAAFEETIKHLTAASVRGRKDRFNGAIENVMVGKLVPIGTGMFDLAMVDEKEEKKEEKK